jgi:hypothetical protein
MHGPKLSLLAATFMLLLNATAYGGNLDVVGIKLGMTQPQILEVFKKQQCNINSNSNTVKFDVLPTEPMTFGLRCSTPDRSTIHVGLSGAPAPSQVFGVRRDVILQNQPLTLSNLMRSLREKYGKENVLDNTLRRAAWFFDKSGKPITTPRISDIGGCKGMSYVSTTDYRPHNYDPSMKDAQRISQAIASNINPNCETIVYAHWLVDMRNGDLVTQFSVELADHQAWLKSLQDLNQYLTKAENTHQSRKKQKAEKQGGPRL